MLAAVLVSNPGGFRPGQPADRAASVLRDAWRSPPVRAWLLSALIGGAAVGALILYQVPVTARAGLPLGVAAAVAGFRGLAQLDGRLPLTGLTGSLGARNTLVLAYAVGAIATLLLFVGAGSRRCCCSAWSLAPRSARSTPCRASTPTNSSTRATWAWCSASSKQSSP